MMPAHSTEQEPAESERDQAKDRPIPPAHIRGRASSRCHLDAEGSHLELRGALQNFSLITDSCSDASVRGSQQVSAGFDGTHAGHLEMLERAERAAEPGIITDIHQHLRFGQKFRDFSTKDRLVADECPLRAPLLHSGRARPVPV